jgi:hypothetical protein
MQFTNQVTKIECLEARKNEQHYDNWIKIIIMFVTYLVNAT